MIPYEAQLTARMCGAAALCMVYRSFGLDCTQAEVWKAIQEAGPDGAPGTKTHLLAQDALGRGLAALVVQANRPWATLQACTLHNVRAILNHRLSLERPEGHYSAVAEINDREAFLHDPLLGPSRRQSRADLLQMWQA